MKIENYQKVIESFYIKYSPSDALSYFHLAQIYSQLKNYEEALKYINEVIELKLEDEKILKKIDILINLQRYEEAISLSEKIIKKFNDHRCFFLDFCPLKKHDLALKFINQANKTGTR